MRGEPGPWSQDHIIQEYKFTNAYRASDRASQFLIRNVIYDGHENQRGPEDTFFRILLFKIFNLPETWEYLQGKTELTWTGDKAKLDTLDHWLTQAIESGVKIFSGAYIQSSAGANGSYKHTAWLQILGKMMSDGLPAKIARCASMEAAYRLLLSYEHLGDF